MQKIILLLICLLGFAVIVDAQKCRTSERRAAQLAKHPEMQQRIDKINDFTEQWIQDNADNIHERGAVVTLPIVIHILHNAPSENISETQILSQLAVLNNDFRKLNSNFSNTPAPFTGVATDTEIQFCMATVDPNGNPTSGITRTSVGNNFDIQNDFWDSTYGGKDPWDVKKYINIWIGDLGQGLLGFATPPGTAQYGDDDGMVIDYRAWGTIGTAANNQPNHLGRTATHEMGHYLNLEHLWGPGNGGCNEDDMVTDTPPQDDANYGCPIFPSTDNCSGNDGIMFTNYLGYADDYCMTMFTQGQKARMLAAINGPRAGLLTSTACNGEVSIVNTFLDLDIDIFPNPTSDYLYIDIPNKELTQIELIDVNGQILYTQNNEIDPIQRINIQAFNSGIYFIKIIQEDKFLIKKILIHKK